MLPAVASGASLHPYGLTTDLIERTDVVYQGGYPSSLTLPQASLSSSVFQYAAISTRHPRLGWIVDGGGRRDVMQEAYRIRFYKVLPLKSVAPAKNAKQYEYPVQEENRILIWDSEETVSNRSAGVEYGGPELEPSSIYAWEVRTWDNYGVESEWSDLKYFKTAAVLDDASVSIEPLVKTDQRPVSLERLADGSYFADFGKDAFGQVSLTIDAGPQGGTAVLHLGERVRDGHVDRTPFGTCRYRKIELRLFPGTHSYKPEILPDWRNTHGDAVLMPSYIGEVMPFRYLEIEGLDEAPRDVIRHYVHHPFGNSAQFSSSDDVLNALWELCAYSMEATSFTGYHIDGDRERIPYECDALINQLCVYGVDRLYSLSRRSVDYLFDHPTWPTEWILQTVLMAWYDYLYTGDDRLLRARYDALASHTLIALKQDNGLISTRIGEQTPQFLSSIGRRASIRDIVDWPQGRGSFGLPGSSPGEADYFEFSDYNAVVNAYHYATLRCMNRVALALCKEDDALRWDSEAKAFKELYNKSFFDRKAKVYRDFPGGEHSALHSNMFPLAFGLVPPKRVADVASFVESRGMACSIANAKFLLDALYEAGEGDAAYKLLADTGERSWYNTVRAGSTITLEAWDDKFKANQDWNHAWGGAPADLLPHRFIGIEPLTPGWETFRVKPQLSSVEQAAASVPTVRGSVSVTIVNKAPAFDMTLDIPANVKALVYVPVPEGAKGELTLDGQPVKALRDATKRFFVVGDVGSGERHFSVR